MDFGWISGSFNTGVSTSETTDAAGEYELGAIAMHDDKYIRMSGRKLKTAVIRRRDVATRGLDIACLTCVSTVRRAVRPTLSIAYVAGDVIE